MVSPKTVPEALESAAAQNSGGFGYLREDGSEHFEAFEMLLGRVRAVAGGLREGGLAPRDVVGIAIADPETFLHAFLGASYAGLVPAPVCPPAPRGAPKHSLDATLPMLDASGARAVLTSGPLVPIFESLRAGPGPLEQVVGIEAVTGPALPHAHSVTLDAPAFVQFTSGSASAPKGVVLTHRNLAANIAAIMGPDGLAIQDHDVGVSWLPLFHDLGLIGMALTTLYRGVRTQFIPSTLFLKRPAEWLRAISRHRATVSFAPSFAYDLCARRVNERELVDLDLSSWRVAGCGAEPIQASALAAFSAAFKPAGFDERSLLSCYGLAEHTLAVTFSPLVEAPRVDTVEADTLAGKGVAVPCATGAPSTAAVVSCGRPFPDHTVQVVDRRSRPLPERHVGEIVVDGPSVMRGYLTEDSHANGVSQTRPFRTGDLGYLVDGELYVCGRLKEIIIISGRNYFPQDVERAVEAVPGVRTGRVVAFGTTPPDGPERLVVVVAVGPATTSTTLARDIRGQVLERLGVTVDGVVTVSNRAITRTTSGKLQRARVKAAYEAGELGPPLEWTAAAQTVAHSLATSRDVAR